MTDVKIHLNVDISPISIKALKKVQNYLDLGFIMDHFTEVLLKERYREFVIHPTYTYNRNGARMAMPIPRREKKQNLRVQVPCSVMHKIRRLQKRGLEIGWMLEEALYFASHRGLLPS